MRALPNFPRLIVWSLFNTYFSFLWEYSVISARGAHRAGCIVNDPLTGECILLGSRLMLIRAADLAHASGFLRQP